MFARLLKWSRPATCAAFAGLALACGQLKTPPKPTHIETTDLSSATEGDREFAVRFYRALAQEPGNVFCSPASVRMSLTMAWAGARGQTADELRAATELRGQPPALHIANANLIHAWTKPPPNAPQNIFTLRLANGFFAQRERQFAQEYVELLSHRYEAPLSPKDFAASGTTRDEINRWIDNRTDGKISDPVSEDSIQAGTQLLLVSAVYFKASWKSPFQSRRTTPGDFKRADGKSVRTQLMTQSASFAYAETPEAQILELPYVGDGFVMDLILPRAELTPFESALDENKLEQLLSALSPKDVNVVIPKWESDSRVNLREPLKKIGVHAAFEKGQADFSGMDGSRLIFVSAVLHQAFLSVDEGAEAASSGPETAASGGVVFRADRPFIYLIRDKNRNVVLGFGRFSQPGQPS